MGQKVAIRGTFLIETKSTKMDAAATEAKLEVGRILDGERRFVTEEIVVLGAIANHVPIGEANPTERMREAHRLSLAMADAAWRHDWTALRDLQEQMNVLLNPTTGVAR